MPWRLVATLPTLALAWCLFFLPGNSEGSIGMDVLENLPQEMVEAFDSLIQAEAYVVAVAVSVNTPKPDQIFHSYLASLAMPTFMMAVGVCDAFLVISSFPSSDQRALFPEPTEAKNIADKKLKELVEASMQLLTNERAEQYRDFVRAIIQLERQHIGKRSKSELQNLKDKVKTLKRTLKGKCFSNSLITHLQCLAESRTRAVLLCFLIQKSIDGFNGEQWAKKADSWGRIITADVVVKEVRVSEGVRRQGPKQKITIMDVTIKNPTSTESKGTHQIAYSRFITLKDAQQTGFKMTSAQSAGLKVPLKVAGFGIEAQLTCNFAREASSSTLLEATEQAIDMRTTTVEIVVAPWTEKKVKGTVEQIEVDFAYTAEVVIGKVPRSIGGTWKGLLSTVVEQEFEETALPNFMSRLVVVVTHFGAAAIGLGLGVLAARVGLFAP